MNIIKFYVNLTLVCLSASIFVIHVSSSKKYAFSSFQDLEYEYHNDFINGNEEYDFVIVGGGQSGCIVADRLSEYREFSVLVLEAGGKPPLISQVPFLSFLLMNSPYDWNYTSVPQTYVDNRIMALARGKMLGGTQSLNACHWFRGHKRDFDIWKSLGVVGWEWEQNLEYFKKSQKDYSTDANSYSYLYSGFSGPIPTENPWKGLTLFSSFLNQFRKRGYVYNDPINGDTVGFNVMRLNTYQSQRQTSYTNQLVPAMKRKNLKIITFATVEKILFNENKEAIGVLYSKNGRSYNVFAKREVIVSAGAINTPQLLMLSGIGHRDHLESLNIDVVHDLPVGDNLQDHAMYRGNFSKEAYDVYNPGTLEAFFHNEGPLTNFSGASAFINTDLSTDLQFPDVQLSINGGYFNHMTNEIEYQLLWYLLRPESRGTIRLRSNDPYEYPLINPNYLSAEYDVNIMLRLAQSIVSIGNAIAQKQNEFSFIPIDTRNCLHLKNQANSDQFWRCIVRKNIQMACHFCCSARMGSTHDRRSVVDSELKVIGVKRLRVIDASVMPTVPSSNIQGVVSMVAEKGADLVKQIHVPSLSFSTVVSDCEEMKHSVSSQMCHRYF